MTNKTVRQKKWLKSETVQPSSEVQIRKNQMNAFESFLGIGLPKSNLVDLTTLPRKLASASPLSSIPRKRRSMMNHRLNENRKDKPTILIVGC